MTYELITSADRYTLVAREHVIAAAVCVLLGEGRYALKQKRGAFRMPPILDGAVHAYFKRVFGTTPNKALNRRAEIAACLQSLLIGNTWDRIAFDRELRLMAPKEKPNYRQRWNDMRRTSLNDIGALAWGLAEVFRTRRKVSA